MSIAEKLTQIAENEPKVYEAGRKAEHDEFWGKFNINGARNTFSGMGWNKDTFKPNRDFTVMQSAFYYHNWGGTPYDLAAQLEELGVTMRMGSTADSSTFYCAWFTRLPELDFSAVSGIFDRVFYQTPGTGLHTIDKIILPAEGKITSFNDPFLGCTKLNNVIFEGVIDKSISFSSSPLTVASMKNIISCLKDYSVEAPFSYTLTLKDICKTELEADTETVEFNGSTYTYFELITAKGWNLA